MYMPEMKVKKCRETVFEDSNSDSESDEESDTEQQSSTSRRKTVRFAKKSERLIGIDASNEERRHESVLGTRSSL